MTALHSVQSLAHSKVCTESGSSVFEYRENKSIESVDHNWPTTKGHRLEEEHQKLPFGTRQRSQATSDAEAKQRRDEASGLRPLPRSPNEVRTFLISIQVKRSAPSVKAYFKEHLENGEYYSEKGKHDGIWHGKALTHFGLQEGSQVESQAFDAFTDGISPLSGQKLTARQKEKRRSCYDLVFSRTQVAFHYGSC